MIEALSNWDQELFLKLNALHSPFWDEVMFHISGKLEWIPLYLLILVQLFRMVKWKIWLPLIAIALCVLLADQLSVHAFKDVFQRYRPCHNLLIGGEVHTYMGKCGGKFGFVSSHAANTFVLASFLFFFFKRNGQKHWAWLFLWSAIVAYSRIYLGKHYPLDVLGGALLGLGIAYGIYRLLIVADKRWQFQLWGNV